MRITINTFKSICKYLQCTYYFNSFRKSIHLASTNISSVLRIYRGTIELGIPLKHCPVLGNRSYFKRSKNDRIHINKKEVKLKETKILQRFAA